jgi:hypothetical protein
MTVPAMQSWPIGGRDAEWNGSDARRRVVDHYTTGETTDWEKVHKCFFHYYPDKAELKTGHNLGYVDIVNGTPKAIPHGIFAVAGGHGVTSLEGIPSDEVTKVKKQVNKWYGKMKKEIPNDDFAFDPPFPDVKENKEEKSMPDANANNTKHTRLENLRKEYDRVKTQLKSHLEQKFMVGGMGNASTFADLAAIDAIWDTIDKVFQTVWDFQFLAENIAWNSESPNAMLKGVKDLSIEMAAIFTKMSKDVPGTASEVTESDKALTNFINSDPSNIQDWTIKQGKSSALLKNSKGEQFFYGRFTNNIWDKDGEVLLTEAHQEFVDYLDSHPDEAPELWDWHEEDTAKASKAVWWDYADGFLHSIWPVTEKEAQGIEAFMEEFEPGMSHGFKVLERKGISGKEIAQYRTKEASILPVEFAANEWTTFDLLDVMKAMSEEEKEERQKMFSPEKQRALELLSLGEYQMPLGKASEDDAAALDASGAQRKDKKAKEGKTMTKKDDKTDQEVPTTTPTPVPAPELATLQASIVEGFDLLTKAIAEMGVQVKANSEALQGIKKTKGQSPSVAAWVAAQKAQDAGSSVPTDPAKADDAGVLKEDDPLFGVGPEETPYELDGHLLAKY